MNFERKTKELYRFINFEFGRVAIGRLNTEMEIDKRFVLFTRNSWRRIDDANGFSNKTLVCIYFKFI